MSDSKDNKELSPEPENGGENGTRHEAAGPSAADKKNGRGRSRAAKFGRGATIGFVAFFLIVAVFALFFSAPMIRTYGLPSANEALKSKGFSLTAASVSGRPITGVTMIDFEIKHAYPGQDSVTVFRADTLTVKYNIGRFFRKDWRIDYVRLANPEILLISPPEGGVLLPGLVGKRSSDGAAGGDSSAAGESGGRGRGPTVDIRRIDLANAVLRVSTVGGEEVFRDMDLTCYYRRTPWETEIGLKKASFEMPGRHFSITHTAADMVLKQGVLYMENGVAKLPSSDIDFSGNISFKDKVRYDIDCAGHPYDVPELALIIKNNWPAGRMEGEASVYGPGDSLSIAATVSGTVERFTLEGVDVKCLRGARDFTFSRIQGVVNGTKLAATGRIREDAQSFDIHFSGLDASHGFFPSVKEFPPTDLDGFAAVRHPGARAAWFIEALMHNGHVAEFEFADLYFSGNVNDLRIAADSIFVGRPEMRAYAKGKIGLGPSGQMDLTFKADLDSLDYSAAWLGAGELHGSLRATGNLSGPSADPVLSAWGPLGWVGRGPATLEGGTFEAVVQGLADPVPIRFSLNGGDATFNSWPLGVLTLRGLYEKRGLEVPYFHLAKGDSTAEGSFFMHGEKGDVITEFDHLDFQLNGLDWRSDHPFTFTYEEGTYSLQGFRLTHGDGTLAVSGMVDDRQKQVELNVAATGMQVTSLSFPGGEFTGGTISGALSLTGPISAPSGKASVTWTGTKAFDREVREMALKCELQPGELSIERLWVDFEEGASLITGRADFTLDLAEIFSGGVRDLLDRTTGSRIDLSLSITDLDLGWVGGLVSDDPGISGVVSLSGAVKGSLVNPVLDINVNADSLSARGLSIDSFSGAFEYSEGTLRASRARLKRGNVSAVLEGYLPVLIGSGTGVKLLSENPMALEVDVTPGDFAVVGEVWDRLARSSGSFVVDATVTGTPSAPVLSGSGWFKDCAMRLAGMEEEYRNVSCKYMLNGDMIEVTEIVGEEGKKGSFRGSGVIRLSWPGISDYNFDIKFEQMAVLTPIDYDAIVSGELIITTFPLDNGKLIPQIAGNLVVDEGSYTGALGGASEIGDDPAAAGTVTPSWFADLEIVIPGNLVVNNADADLLLAGDVIVTKDFNGVQPRGDLQVVSGTYYLVNTEFEVTSGTISFGEAVGVNPDLDITAETVLGSDESGFEETIYIHLTGTAREPRITVSSTSGYSETDIYNMLLAGTLWGQGPQEVGGPDISVLATNTLFNAIDARLRDILGTRPPVTIGLTREQNLGQGETPSTAETRISVGRNLSRRLFLEYEQGFSAITRREVNLDYRVNRFLLLRSQIINNPERGIREESSSEINFDMKLRFEF